MHLDITIDTREQAPWGWPQELVTAQMKKLNAGDYALTGDDLFSIERKSMSDFVGTVVSGWARFGRELKRVEEAGPRASMVIIVEGNYSQILAGDYRSGVDPKLISKRIAQLTLRGFPVLFGEDRRVAAVMAYSILRQRAHERSIFG